MNSSKYLLLINVFSQETCENDFDKEKRITYWNIQK